MKLPPIHKQGAALIDEVAATDLAGGELACWWLGQHSFILKLAGTVVLVDPYLTSLDARRVPPLFTPEQATIADIVIGSHDHLDHIDRAAWPGLAAASDAVFCVPKFNMPELAEATGIDPARFAAFNDGESQTIAGVTLTAHASAHERLDRDPKTGFYPWLGYVIEAGGCVVHHPGDTVWYEGLLTRLLPWQGRIDLALYPINGRDAERWRINCLGNMTFQESVDLAGELGARHAMPTHWDMFAENPGDPDAFEAFVNIKWPNVKCLRPGYGERVVVGQFK